MTIAVDLGRKATKQTNKIPYGLMVITHLSSLPEAFKIVKSGLFQLMTDLGHLYMHNPGDCNNTRCPLPTSILQIHAPLPIHLPGSLNLGRGYITSVRTSESSPLKQIFFLSNKHNVFNLIIALCFKNKIYTVNVLKFRALLFLFSNNMLVIKLAKMLVRITNRIDPDHI